MHTVCVRWAFSSDSCPSSVLRWKLLKCFINNHCHYYPRRWTKKTVIFDKKIRFPNIYACPTHVSPWAYDVVIIKSDDVRVRMCGKTSRTRSEMQPRRKALGSLKICYIRRAAAAKNRFSNRFFFLFVSLFFDVSKSSQQVVALIASTNLVASTMSIKPQIIIPYRWMTFNVGYYALPTKKSKPIVSRLNSNYYFPPYNLRGTRNAQPSSTRPSGRNW